MNSNQLTFKGAIITRAATTRVAWGSSGADKTSRQVGEKEKADLPNWTGMHLPRGTYKPRDCGYFRAISLGKPAKGQLLAALLRQ